MTGDMEEVRYSRRAIDRAGDTLKQLTKNGENGGLEESLMAVSYWKGLYSEPLTAFNNLTRSRVRRSKTKPTFIAQRLKRIEAIRDKLRRFERLDLSVMQDIAGLRIVVRDTRTAKKLIRYLLEMREHSGYFELLPNRIKDYIETPKSSGYRSLHLVYRGKEKYKRLFFELQIRTELQHAWAVAVETVDFWAKQELKIGKGKNHWRNFFVLCGAAFAHLEEQRPVVPGYEGRGQ